MLKDRAELENKLIDTMVKNMSKQNSVTVSQQWYLELFEKYNIPIAMSSDIVAQRKDLSEYNEFILYCITDIILPKQVADFFTETEVKMYQNQKLILDSVNFPLKLHLDFNKDSRRRWILQYKDYLH